MNARETTAEDDEEEDLDDADDTSTIVPSSPLNSRRNSLAHDDSLHKIGITKLDRAGLGPNGVVAEADGGNRHRRRKEAGGELAVDDAEEEDDEKPSDKSTLSSSKLSPRVAVILGVDRKWYLPLVICRALSVAPALWWGLRCAFTFLAELLRIRPGMWREGWVAIIVSSAAADWDVERRFRVTEVALAIMWCCASAYLSYFFMDCMMSRWLLNYSPPAVLIRLLATNGLFAYLTSSVLFLSGASSDPRLLLPAWISITTTLTFLYHATQNHAMIKRETTASVSVLSVASYISMSLILLQMHLTRDNEPEVPAFVMGQKVLDWIAAATATATSSLHATTSI